MQDAQFAGGASQPVVQVLAPTFDTSACCAQPCPHQHAGFCDIRDDPRFGRVPRSRKSWMAIGPSPPNHANSKRVRRVQGRRRTKKVTSETYHALPTELLPPSSASRRYCAALNCDGRSLAGAFRKASLRMACDELGRQADRSPEDHVHHTALKPFQGPTRASLKDASPDPERCERTLSFLHPNPSR